MKKLFLVLASSLLMAAAAPVSLVQNEYDFAKVVAKKGTREGFLLYLDKQAVTLSPRPVNDYVAHQKAKPSGAKLTWTPAWALVSSSGDFGVDTGPWTYEFSGKDGKAQKAHGDWVTIWARGKDGSWKALFDAGIDHAPPAKPPAPLTRRAKVPQLMALPGEPPSTATLRDQLQRAEEVFSNDMLDIGPRDTYQKMGMDELRLLQEDHAAVVGKPAVMQAVPTAPMKRVWIPMGGSLARSGDLGYLYGMTYGVTDAQKRQKPLGSFMHVWQRGTDGWKLLLDMEMPFPPEK